MSFATKILPIVLSLISIAILVSIRKRVPKESYLFSFWVSCIVFFTIYILLILSTIGLHYKYQAELNSYDLNMNGNFEESERVDGYQEAMDKVIQDTARNFVHIVGIILSFIISTTVFTVGALARLFKSRTKK